MASIGVIITLVIAVIILLIVMIVFMVLYANNEKKLKSCQVDLSNTPTSEQINKYQTDITDAKDKIVKCTNDLTSCNDNLATTKGKYDQCDKDLTSCNNNLTSTKEKYDQCNNDLTSYKENLPPNYPKKIGCYGAETDFCICNSDGTTPAGCPSCVPYNLYGNGGNFSKSLENASGHKYMALARTSAGDQDDGYMFAFDEIKDGSQFSKDGGCGVICANDAEHTCGCSDNACPASQPNKRSWMVYQVKE